MSKPRQISDYPNRANDYEEAVSKMHDQNTDSALDEGGDNEVSAEQLRTHIDSTDNPHGVTAGQVGAYTKGEADDLLDDKFDKSGGTIEGVTTIETDSPAGLEIVRTGTNAGRAGIRIGGTGRSGLAPELIIAGDAVSDTPGLPLYNPGRISTRDGFYIGSTRKDLEWDAKADQSDLNATNQAVSNLDGRVDTAEDNIQDLEEGKADANDPVFTGVFGYGQNVRMRYDDSMPSSPVILIAQANHPDGVDTTGEVIGYRRHSNTTNAFRLQFTAYAQYNASPAHPASSMTYKLDAGSYGNISAEPISCTYEGNSYFAVRITGSPVPNGYIVEWAGRTVSNSPIIVSANNIDNIQSVGVGRTIYGQPVIVQGTVTTTDIITTSRVESDRKGALSALNNMSEWKKKDGTIDYKKHYAYTPQVVRDEKGKVIEEKPGLSMEKRVAMLEKMVHELHSKNTDLTQKLANINKRQ